MRSRLLAASAALLLLPACQSSGSDPAATPGYSDSTSSPSAASTSAAPEPTAREALAAALRRLKADGRANYWVTMQDDGLAVLNGNGSFDRARTADRINLRILDKKSLDGVWVEDINIGHDHYLKVPVLFGPAMDKCYLKVTDGQLTSAQLDYSGLHLDPVRLLSSVKVTGYGLSSHDFIEARLRVSRLAPLVGIGAVDLRQRIAASPATVPIQITVSDGRLERWDVTADDLARAMPPGLTRTERALALFGDFSYALDYETADEVLPPPDREVAVDPQRGCAAGGTAA
ncbi:MAG: hypothetical protein U0R78_07995 [Nocardioidaceae bacterium]